MLLKWNLLWWLWHSLFHKRLADWPGDRPVSSVVSRPTWGEQSSSIHGCIPMLPKWISPSYIYEFTYLFDKTSPQDRRNSRTVPRKFEWIPSPGHVGRLRGPWQADQREHRETTSCPGVGVPLGHGNRHFLEGDFRVEKSPRNKVNWFQSWSFPPWAMNKLCMLFQCGTLDLNSFILFFLFLSWPVCVTSFGRTQMKSKGSRQGGSPPVISWL